MRIHYLTEMNINPKFFFLSAKKWIIYEDLDVRVFVCVSVVGD